MSKHVYILVVFALLFNNSFQFICFNYTLQRWPFVWQSRHTTTIKLSYLSSAYISKCYILSFLFLRAGLKCTECFNYLHTLIHIYFKHHSFVPILWLIKCRFSIYFCAWLHKMC
ncbi:hypothetical protein BDF19DRAFT_156830 [Syncephalis fuscata]|nr:hypothetical protein BDF19DRAFT_156830 [Syncephalis fuscata]